MLKSLLCLAVAGLFAASSHAAPAKCATHYPSGELPIIQNANLTPKTRELCYGGFALMHSGISRTPLWVVEYLTRDGLDKSQQLDRVDKFHPEKELPESERSELSDYLRSGFDKGHMAPSADQLSQANQKESFSLANMIPQNPHLNQQLWAGIEATTRTMARRRGALYVITGPLFLGSKVGNLNGRVLIPTHVFKLVYDPVKREAGAYFAPNNDSGDYERLTLAELDERAGITFLPREGKLAPMSLMPPKKVEFNRDGHGNKSEQHTPVANHTSDAAKGILGFLKLLGNFAR